MFKHARAICLGAALLLILGATAVAASKVAIIKVNSGSATLDGKTIAKAGMANEGQLLKVAGGSEVRIQLLGSKQEVTVTGPAKLEINKSDLSGRSTEVSRSSATVAADIGNKNTVSASTSRGEASKLTKLLPTLPPRFSKDGEYVLEFQAGDSIELEQDHSIKVEVKAMEGEAPPVGAIFDHEYPLVAIQMPPDLEKGRAYRFTLIYSDPGGYMGQGGAMYKYQQSFRILTEDQQSFLKEAEQELMQDYKTEKDVLPLLRIASLYQEYDQNDKVLEFMKMAYNSEYLDNEEQWNSLRDTIRRFEDSLTMPVPLGK